MALRQGKRAEKGFKFQDIKNVTPRFLDEETPSGDKQRCISHYVKLHESTAWQCYWNCASWELQALQPGKKHFLSIQFKELNATCWAMLKQNHSTTINTAVMTYCWSWVFPSKQANTPNGWAWAARRPEGSLPGAVHHDLACVHRAGASVGSVSKAPALSPSNWSMEIFRRSKVSCYMLVSRRIS